VSKYDLGIVDVAMEELEEILDGDPSTNQASMRKFEWISKNQSLAYVGRSMSCLGCHGGC